MNFDIFITRSDGASVQIPVTATTTGAAFSDGNALELVRLIRDAFAECDLIPLEPTRVIETTGEAARIWRILRANQAGT